MCLSFNLYTGKIFALCNNVSIFAYYFNYRDFCFTISQDYIVLHNYQILIFLFQLFFNFIISINIFLFFLNCNTYIYLFYTNIFAPKFNLGQNVYQKFGKPLFYKLILKLYRYYSKCFIKFSIVAYPSIFWLQTL